MFNKTIIIALILTAMTTFICYVAESQEYVTDGLVGFWTMDKQDIQGNTVKDVSGNNNHGEINGDPKIVKGKIEEALHFDGGDDFVQLPDMGEEMQTSVEVWAYAESFGTWNGLVASGQWAAGSIHFCLSSGMLSIIKNGEPGENLGPKTELEKWYHFAYTSDAEKGEIDLYMNGKLELEIKDTPNDPMSLHIVRIGDEHSAPRLFHGILDEARIYNRILSEKEIKQNYEVKSNELAVNPAFKLSICWGKIKSSR